MIVLSLPYSTAGVECTFSLLRNLKESRQNNDSLPIVKRYSKNPLDRSEAETFVKKVKTQEANYDSDNNY